MLCLCCAFLVKRAVMYKEKQNVQCLASHLDSVSHYKQQMLVQRPEMRLVSAYNMLQGVSCYFYS